MWQIKIHHLVMDEDFKKIPSGTKKHILETIQKKLTIDPQHYGEPLRGEFSGYYRLRIEDYRAVYRILKDQVVVLVVKVGIRKDDQVYKELFTRLRKIP